MNTWVVRCEDQEGTTYAYAFTPSEGETPQQAGEDFAEGSEMAFIEVMPIEDFIGPDVYELVIV